MRHGKSVHDADGHVSSWKIFLASTGLIVVLLSLDSVLEAVQGTNMTPPRNIFFSEKDKERQQQLRDFASGEKVGATSKVTTTTQAAPNERFDHGENLLDTIASMNTNATQFYPFLSMFSSPAKDWKRSHDDVLAATGKMLRVYVYDSLPVKYTESVTSCIMKLAGVYNSSTFSSLSTKMADVAIIQLFQTYPGRVYNPQDADIFVVPYAHTAHCYCTDGWEKACAQVSDAAIDEVFGSLQYYNSSTAARHLFVLSGIQYFINARLMQQPLKLLGGNLSPTEVVKKTRGTIVIPYLNDKAVFQQIFTAPESWWTRPRHYAFSFVFGQSNKRNTGYDPRKIRKHFQQSWLHRNRTVIGGLPVYLQAFDHVTTAPTNTVWMAFDRYQDSIFCPILAGDSCQQARFFDAMFAGCIPVVLSYHTTDIPERYKNSWAANLTSWYKEAGETTPAVYPFHISLVDFGIDYDKCVLTVPAKVQRDVRKLVNAMEDAILSHPDKILQLQTNLRDCAIRTAFGMGSNAHKHDDAFAQIIRMIRYYLDGLELETA